MIVTSDVTGITYDDMETVFYRNVIQAGWMLSHADVKLIDLFADSKMKIVFVFTKESHKKYIGEWSERRNKI